MLYGAFHLLRQAEKYSGPLRNSPSSSAPRVGLRLLNHWDNLDRSVERGYAGPLAMGLGAPAGLDAAALSRLRARQRLDRHQRDCPDQRERQRPRAHAGVSRERWRRWRTCSGRTASRCISRRVSARRWSSAASRRPIRSTRRCAHGGRPRPTRSTGSIPDFGGFLVKANSRRPAGAAGLQAHARRRRQHARRCRRAARRRRDVARLRVQQRRARRSRQAGVRRVHAARRQVPCRTCSSR